MSAQDLQRSRQCGCIANALPMTDPLDRRESSETDHAEILRAGRYHVIPCKDKIRWIIPRRDIQAKRIRTKFSLSEAQVRLTADLYYLGGRDA